MAENSEPTPWAALVAALGELSNPPKNRMVEVPGKYRFEYADLATILSTVRPILSRHGLCLLQPVRMQEGAIMVSTRIVHTSGMVVAECELSSRDPMQPQAQGSQITYLRRYGIASLLGIAAEDDDDGAAAGGVAATHAPKGGKSRPESTNKSNGPTYREQVRLLLEAAGIPAAWVDSDRKRRG